MKNLKVYCDFYDKIECKCRYHPWPNRAIPFEMPSYEGCMATISGNEIKAGYDCFVLVGRINKISKYILNHERKQRWSTLEKK
jgi:hypothetical protein